MDLEIKSRQRTSMLVSALLLSLLVPVNVMAQDDRMPQDGPRSSATVGKMKTTSARKPASSNRAPSQGGILQQFKSMSNKVFGAEEDIPPQNANIPQPPPLEARRRRVAEPFQKNPQTESRNEAARSRGMPAPPPMDPPSLTGGNLRVEPLPPVEDAKSRLSSRKSTTAQDGLTKNSDLSLGDEPAAVLPKVPASTESSSRRKPVSTSAPTPRDSFDGSQAPNPRLPSDPKQPMGSRGIEEDSSSPSASVEEDFVPIPKKSVGGRSSSPSSSMPAQEEGSYSAQPPRNAPRVDLEEASSRAPQPRSTSNSSSSSSGNMNTANTLNMGGAVNTNSKNSAKGNLIQMGLPRVELAMNGPSSLRVNESTTYEVVVVNKDAMKLNGLIVRLGIPASIHVSTEEPTLGEAIVEEEEGARSVVWQIEEIEPGVSNILKLNLSTDRPEHFAIDMEWTALPQSGQVALQVQQPMLQLGLEGPSEATFGKPEMYRLRVKNPGNASVKNVTVTLNAEPYGRNSTKIGEVPAGGERTIEVELTFQQAGVISLMAEAKSEEYSLDAKGQIDVSVRQAQLVATITGPEQHYQGSIADYELNIVNQGAIHSEQVKCSLTLPKGAKAVALPEGARLQGQEIVWTLPQLEAGANYHSGIQIQMSETGDFTYLLKAEGTAGGSSHSEAIVRVEAISDLKLSVSDPVAPAPVGKPVVYELLLVNRGSKPATGIKVLAQFSNGIEPIRASGHANQVIPGQVLFDPIESLGPGKEITLRITAQAAEMGMHRFRAEVTCDDSDTQLLHEESTRYLATTRTESGTSPVRR